MSYVFRLFTHSLWWLVIVACGEHTSLCTLEGAPRESHLSHIKSSLETRKATLQHSTRWFRNLHVFYRRLLRGRGWCLGGPSVGSWHAPADNLNGRTWIPWGSLSAHRWVRLRSRQTQFNAGWGTFQKRPCESSHLLKRDSFGWSWGSES